MNAISPKKRRSARERAVQFLFGLDFTKYDWRSAIETFWLSSPVNASVKDYAELLIDGVAGHLEELDGAIDGSLDRWTPDRIGRVERNILRVALFEMRYLDDVPTPVAINEAIEVAKRFGAEDAPRFINGVLDRLKKGN